MRDLITAVLALLAILVGCAGMVVLVIWAYLYPVLVVLRILGSA